jgi:RNA polymerase sigma factor (sigma-70 family)
VSPPAGFVAFWRVVRYTLYREFSVNDPSRENRVPPEPAACDPDREASPREPLSGAEALFVEGLFERHRFELFSYLTRRVGCREIAKEILQETYLRLLRQPSFDQLRQNARAYLFTTATNLARDHFRRSTTHDVAAEHDAFSASGLGQPDWESWPELALQGEQTSELIVNVLQNMTSPMRSALLLHRFRGLTHRQIAECLDTTERTVERYIREGLSLIAKQLRVSS